MEPEHYDRVAAVEEDHWWYTNTRMIMAGLLAPWLGHGRRLLDAGCGPGGNGAWLARHGQVVGVDASAQALRYVRERRPMMQPARSTLMALPFASESFDVVVDITVLCCIADDIAAARAGACPQARRCAGHVGASVQSPLARARRRHACLHRYRRQELADRAHRAGLTVHRTTYAYSYLAPAAAIMGAWFRLNPVSPSEAPSDYDRRSLDRLFGRLAQAERRVLQKHDVPFGTSALVVATRPETR